MLSHSLRYGFAVLLTATSLTACGLTGDSSGGSDLLDFGKKGDWESDLAVIAYTQGNFDEADEHVLEALHDNKKNAQALLVGALLSEKTNRPNRARQYYEEILLYNGNEVSVLGSSTPQPEKITDIARKRLRQLNLRQNKLIIEDKQGNKVFNISNEASVKNGTKAMQDALALRKKRQGTSTANSAAIESLFNDGEKNTISRFIILKELAENDMITKEEFLRARQANIGGLLPLTYAPASSQVIKPVPSSRIIMDRINALKSALEDRAISAKEFSAERNLIIEAILPPSPAQRLKRKAPSKEIITAAKDLRKLEVLYDLNLITSGEKDKEKALIEQALGLNGNSSATTEGQAVQTGTAPDQTTVTVTTTATTVPVPVTITTAQPQVIAQPQIIQQQPQIIQTTQDIVKLAEPAPITPEEVIAPTTIPANKPSPEAQPIIPAVSSPFIDH